ncbi:ABC transporter substrate-binding protein [Streptomyces sp. SHP 1-2]|uniref:ABC transporter substrate-binding protein n=1 Tax=Streptomyces sp. SHP 1-2 TaxID=2769489 RepID=UPI002237214B|nr:ABC transporter substrate-binding protein [Streptomyces sp. SHP 1-2]MCW5249552.1 ABC transporter substrate-binding protein [Streptomyces sp. SHP 1-2]
MRAFSGRHRVVGATLALLLAGSLAACGKDDTASDGDTKKVTIGKAVDTLGYSIVDIAIEQGFFKERGLDVEVVTLGGSAAANSALAAGDLQFAGLASLPFLQARQSGIDVKSVASLDYGVPLQLVAGGKRKDKLKADAGLKERLEVLKGGTVGFVSSTDGGFIDLMLEQAGLPKDTVRKVAFESAQAAVAAVEFGRLDAAIGSPPTTTAAVERDVVATVASAREIPEYAEMTYDLLVTTGKYAKSNPETVKAVATAVAKANNYVRDKANRAAVVKFETGHFKGFSASTIETSLDIVTFAEGGRQSQEQWDNALATFESGGLLKGGKAVEGEAWTNEYIDSAKLG